MNPSVLFNQKCDIPAGGTNATRFAFASAVHSSATNEHSESGVSNVSWPHALPSGVVRIALEDLALDAGELGRGGFGVVKRALWSKGGAQTAAEDKTTARFEGKEQLEVAVKLLHIDKFKKRGLVAGAGCSELELFVRELRVMAALGTHSNLVQLYGY